MTNYEKNRDNTPIELDGEFQGVLSAADLAYLGLDEIAYIKPVYEDGENVFGVFAADGEPLASAPDFDLAFAMAIQNDLYPVCVN